MLGPLAYPARALLKSRNVNTCNLVFRLHYQATSIIFLTAATILLTNQLFGDPIDCFTHGSASVEGAYKETIDNLCWVTSVFTVKEHLCGRIGTDVPYSGIGTLTPSNTPFDIHVTYRFIFFVLFLQGISFFMPHYIWRSWESNKMKMLSAGLENPLLEENRRTASLHSLTSYLMHGQLNGSIKYAFHLHFCELMNLIIVGMNIWITNFLFRNEFIAYGLTALAETFAGSSHDFDAYCDDPIKALFPQVAKCNQRMYGPSGNVEIHDHLCVLPLNDFNSHFFKFIWVWYAILLVTSIVWLLFRVVSFYNCRLRSYLLARRAGTLPVSASHMHDGANCCSKVASRVSYADWVILMQLGCNMDPLTYKIFLELFCRQTGMKDVKPVKNVDKIYYSPV